MADHAVEDFGDFNVCLVIDRNDLARRAVLALIVRDLPNVLRELVDREAWPSVDRLTLHGTASRQHFLRPLPAVIR